MKTVHRQTDLLEIVLAGYPPGGFPCTLNRRQQQRYQNPNDRDYNQQFDQSKTV